MLGPDYIEHFTDAAQGAMDEYTLRLVCIYAALIGSIDFEGDSAYSQAARKAALAAKDVQKAMNEEGRRAAREAAKAAAEAVAKSARPTWPRWARPWARCPRRCSGGCTTQRGPRRRECRTS